MWKGKATMSRTTSAQPYFPALYSIKEVAGILRVSTKTIRRWVASGELTAHRIGRQWRISDADLQAFIRMRRMV